MGLILSGFIATIGDDDAHIQSRLRDPVAGVTNWHWAGAGEPVR